MAARFWVGGSGNINDTAKWSATSGGSGGVSVPTSVDTATFDLMSNAGAYTVTMNATFTCSDLTIGAPMIGAVTFTSTGAWNIHGSVSVVSSTVMSGATGTITFRATSGTKTISFNGVQLASSVNFNGAGTFQLTSALTTSGTPFIRSAGTFSANSQTVTLNGGVVVMSGVFTFANLTVLGTDSFANVITFNNSPTITGTLTVTGFSATKRMLLASSVLGTTLTITVAALNFNAVDLRDFTKAGAASGDISGASNYTGDCGGNTGWTFTTAVAQTWSGASGGNWSANTWTSRMPLPQDDVVISAAFAAGQTVTLDVPRAGKSIAWSNTGNSVVWAKPTAFSLFGSLTTTSPSLMSQSGTSQITFEGRTAHTLTSNGQTFTNSITQNGRGGTLTMQDSLSCARTVSVVLGTFVGNNFNHTAVAWVFSNSALVTITMGAGTYTASGQSTVFSVGASTVYSGANASILVTDTSAANKTIVGGGRTFGAVQVVSGTGQVIFTGNNTYASIQSNSTSGTVPLKFVSGSTQTITGGASALSGNALGGAISIVSNTPGTRYTITSATKLVCSYLSLTDCNGAGAGIPHTALVSSTDGGNNLNWTFAAASSIARLINNGLINMPTRSLIQ